MPGTEQGALNFDALNDDLRKQLEDIHAHLASKHTVAIVSDEEYDNMVGIFTRAGINLLDNHSCFQNILCIDHSYYIVQLRTELPTRQYGFRNMVSDPRYIYENYDNIGRFNFNTLGYKKLLSDYGTITIEASNASTNLFVELLSHVFSSQEVFVNDHELFADRYRIMASDKAAANVLLNNSFIDTVAKCNDVHIAITGNEMAIWTKDFSEATVDTLLEILGTLKG